MNRYEKVTDQLLTAVAAEHGDRLLAKVRVADVMDVDSLTGAAKHYGLSAHYDFVMIQADTSVPSSPSNSMAPSTGPTLPLSDATDSKIN